MFHFICLIRKYFQDIDKKIKIKILFTEIKSKNYLINTEEVHLTNLFW